MASRNVGLIDSSLIRQTKHKQISKQTCTHTQRNTHRDTHAHSLTHSLTHSARRLAAVKMGDASQQQPQQRWQQQRRPQRRRQHTAGGRGSTTFFAASLVRSIWTNGSCGCHAAYTPTHCSRIECVPLGKCYQFFFTLGTLAANFMW